MRVLTSRAWSRVVSTCLRRRCDVAATKIETCGQILLHMKRVHVWMGPDNGTFGQTPLTICAKAAEFCSIYHRATLTPTPVWFPGVPNISKHQPARSADSVHVETCPLMRIAVRPSHGNARNRTVAMRQAAPTQAKNLSSAAGGGESDVGSCDPEKTWGGRRDEHLRIWDVRFRFGFFPLSGPLGARMRVSPSVTNVHFRFGCQVTIQPCGPVWPSAR